MVQLRLARWYADAVRQVVICWIFGSVFALSAFAGTTTYTYDVQGRLASVTTPTGTDQSNTTITYDNGDNRTALVYQYQDLTKPNSPTNLTAVAQAYNWIQLNWTSSLDVGGGPVAQYKIYRGGSVLGSTASPPYSDQTVAANTPYTYTVSAVDPSGNESPQSTPASATTPPGPDLVAPTVPANLQATPVSGTWINLTWTASTDSGGSGLAGYNVYRNGGPSPIATTTVASYADQSLAPATTYTYTVNAFDGAGNPSGQSNQAMATTPDTIAPSAPGNPTFTSVTTNSATANWTAAGDNVGVVSYRYSLSGGASWTVVGNVLTTNISGLALGTGYTMLVEAEDGAGNWGASSSGSFTTIAYLTDTMSFVPSFFQTGSDDDGSLTYWAAYIQGLYGVLSPSTTSNGKTLQGFESINQIDYGISNDVLYVYGFTSDPGAGWLVSIGVAGGPTLTGASAPTYHYTSSNGGLASWTWPGVGAAGYSGTLTIVHY